MQPLDNHMDDIIRQAAEDYPLNTASADWEKLQQKLQTPPQRPGNRKRFLWLLVLLPVAMIWYGWPSGSEQSEQKAAILEVVENGGEEGVELSTAEKLSTSADTVQPQLVIVMGGESEHRTGTGFAEQNTSSEKTSNSTSVSTPEDRSSKKNIVASSSTFTNAPVKEQAGRIANGEKTQNSFTTNQEPYKVTLIPVRSLLSFSYHPLGVKERQRIAANQRQKKKQDEKLKKFYAGLTGGIDYTTIRFQQLEAPGFDAGFLVGYNFNRHWSMETGLLYNKKFYYTRGTHFQFKDYYLPPSTKLQTVNGVCYMWELPLRMRYTFGNGERQHWFVGLGSSSYILNKERYNYAVTYGYNPQLYTHTKQNEPGSFLPFAMLEFSGGYTTHISKSVSVRIEPILKLPLQRIGSGSLPMQSSAIRLTVTKPLF